MAGVGVVARCVHARLVVCLSWEPRARSWRRRCWASRGVGLDLVVVVGGGWGSGQLDRVTDQDRPGAREDRSLVGASECSEAHLLRQADQHAAGESLGSSCRVNPNIK